MDTIDITKTELEKEQAAQCKTYRSFRNEEEYWRLKSRSLWLEAGDRNTTYFHRQCRARLSRNHITEITTNDGRLCKGIDQIKVVVVYISTNFTAKRMMTVKKAIKNSSRTFWHWSLKRTTQHY
jgi:hypothetical protein